MTDGEARLLADFAPTSSLLRPCRCVKGDTNVGKLSGVTVGRDAQEATKKTRRKDSRGEASGRAEERRETRRRRVAGGDVRRKEERGGEARADKAIQSAWRLIAREEVARRPEGATRGREEPTRCPKVAMRGHGWGRSGAERSLNAARRAGLSPEPNLEIGERRQGRAPRPLTDASTVTPTVSALWNSNRHGKQSQPSNRYARYRSWR